MVAGTAHERFTPHSKEEAAAIADHNAELWALWNAFDVPTDAPPNASAHAVSSHTKQQPKGTTMDMDIDLTADRGEVLADLTDWVAAHKDEIEALPEENRVEVMTNIYNALRIIEDDGVVVLTEDTSWTAFKDRPSSYLIPDVDKLAERAAVYADPATVDHIDAAVQGKAFDTYLVTGDATEELQPVLPAFAAAYREMHDHELVEIPKEMGKYVAGWADSGLDPDVMRDRLINTVADPAETARFEREDIARMAALDGIPERDLTAFENVAHDIRQSTMEDISGDRSGPEGLFTQLDMALYELDSADSRFEQRQAWEKAADEIVVLSELRTEGKLTEQGAEMYDAFVPALVEQHRAKMIASYDQVAHYHASFEANDPTVPDDQKEAEENALYADAAARRTVFEAATADMPNDQTVYYEALAKAADAYRDLQLDLGKVERVIIDNSKVYSTDGVSQVLQETVDTIAQTGRPDLVNNEISRNVLSAFVALEGKDAMRDIAQGNVAPLAAYVDTPENQEVAAKELLTAAKQVDVGLNADEIQKGLETIDPSLSIDTGLSI